MDSIHSILFKNTYTTISSNESIQIRPEVKFHYFFINLLGTTTLKVLICLILATNLYISLILPFTNQQQKQRYIK